MAKQVQARFRLYNVLPAQAWSRPDPEKPEQFVGAALVTLYGVQGEPFGSATPSARVEMVIANAEAARMFIDAPLGQQFDILISPVEQAE